MQVPPGWHADPYGLADRRWWDGEKWSDQTETTGAASLGQTHSAEVATTAAHLEPVLVQIGEIAFTQHWMITPSATMPLRGTQLLVREDVTVQKRIPGYAIVLAIVFFIACLIGLLFLLINEEVPSGSVEVSAEAPGGFSFRTSIPVRSQAEVQEVRRKVDYARSLVTSQQ